MKEKTSNIELRAGRPYPRCF